MENNQKKKSPFSGNKMNYLIWGISPLVLGMIFDGLIKQGFQWGNVMLSGLSIVFFVFWYSIGYSSAEDYDTPLKAFIPTNGFSTVFFLIGGVMVLVAGAFPANFFGHLCEMFFFPAYSISRIVMLSLIEDAPDFACLVLSFILMSATFISGFMHAKKHPIHA